MQKTHIFKTTKKNFKMIEEVNLYKAVNEKTVKVPYQHLLKQCEEPLPMKNQVEG